MSPGNELKVNAATRQLMRSERGQACLQGLEAFLENSCWSLDTQNQHAVVNITLAFFESSHSTLDAIREALS